MSLIVSYFDQFPEWNGFQFEFRGEDGYANVTSLNKVLGRRFRNWSRTKFAKELLDELSTGYGIPVHSSDVSGDKKPLIDHVQGSQENMYVHPAVALSYCMSNPRLQARINMWIINMLTIGTPNPHHKDWTALEYLRGVQFNRDDITDMYG